MDIQSIASLITTVLAVVAGGIALYLRTKTDIVGKAAELIANAEELYKDTQKAGDQKFQWVVEELYALVPAPLRMILSKQVVGLLVQNTFDAIEKYAVHQLDKTLNTEADKASKP